DSPQLLLIPERIEVGLRGQARGMLGQAVVALLIDFGCVQHGHNITQVGSGAEALRATPKRCERRRSPSEIGAIPGLYLADLPVRAEERVLGHVRAVLARFRMAAERFGQGADMVWAGAAANSQIVDAQGMGLAAEVADFRTRTDEGI